MYRITFNDQSVDVVLPCYVRYDKSVKSFVTTTEAKAEAVLVYLEEDSIYCDIATKETRHEGFPLATITKIKNKK